VANDPKYLENYLGYRLQILSVASHVECRLDKKTSICIARLRVYETPVTRISSLKRSRQAVFRSHHSLQTQPCAVTQQPATGSASQLV